MFKKHPHSPLRLHRISFINFTGLRDNWGCQATSWECVKWLQAALPEHCTPDLFLVPLLPRCELDAQLFEKREELCAAMYAVCARTAHWRKALAHLEEVCIARYGEYAVQTRRADLILFQAEGTMAGSDFARGIRLLLLPFVARHAWNIPVLSVNQTLFSCDDQFSNLLAAVYNSFDWVAVRENASLAFGHSLDIEALGLVPDFAFLTHAHNHPDIPAISSDYFAIAGSAFHRAGRYEQLLTTARRIAKRHDLRILIVASNIEQELSHLARHYLADCSYLCLPPHLPYPAVAAALKRCRFLISGRYHMNILAASQLTPVIQLRGNSWKNEGLNGLLAGLAPVMDFADQGAIEAAAEALLTHYVQAKADLRRALAQVHERLEHSQSWLHRLLAGKMEGMALQLQAPLGHPVPYEDCLEPYRSAMLQQASEFFYPAVQSAADLFGSPPVAAQFKTLADQPDEHAQAGLRMFDSLYGHTATAPRSPPLPAAVLEMGMPELFSQTSATLKSIPVEAGTSLPSFHRHDDLRTHAYMLKQEFSGKPQLLVYHALLTVLIRRNQSRAWALARWKQLWETDADFLCAQLDTRWLVSACDTALEHAESQACRALAAAGSLFINTIKLYETERLALDASEPISSDSVQFPSSYYPLHDGLSAFIVGRGDMVHNLYRRVHDLCNDMEDETECMPTTQIVRTLLARACLHDTVLQRFGLRHQHPETSWGPRTLYFCGDSHLRPPQYAERQGWFGALPCKFNMVGGATAIGLRHPTSQTQALQIWEHALLPFQPNLIPVFQLGEVDCGFVIWLRAKKYQEEVNAQLQQSLAAYGRFLCRLRDAGYRDLIVTSAMLPTIQDGQLDGHVAHLRRDVQASLLERTSLTHDYNAQLAAFCRREGLRYLDFTPELQDARTGLIQDYWRHDDQADHHLHTERGGRLWSKKLTELLRSDAYDGLVRT